MPEGLEALSSTLYAQVRDAGPTHGYDSEGYLRPKAHPANISTVYWEMLPRPCLKSYKESLLNYGRKAGFR